MNIFDMIKVGDVLEKVSRQAKVRKADYQDTGILPVIDQGKDYVGGYTNNVGQRYNGPLPVTIFGDHTRILKWVDRPFAVGADGTQLLRADKRFDQRFFYYALSAVHLQHFGYERHFKYLKEKFIPLPDLPTQRKIAAILGAYDDLIENNLRRIKILEEMAQSLYREWFVHFRFPGHESTRFVDSPLGKIPEGWEVKKLGDVLELKYGRALKKKDRMGGPFPVFGSSGIIGNHNASIAQGPGIVVGRKGNVGSVFWSDSDFFVIDTAYFVESQLPLRFLFYLLPTLNFINSDAAVPGLSRQQAYCLEILVPPADLLSKFCIFAGIFEGQASLLQRRNQTLRQTRDLLLPKLLSPKN